MKIIFCFQIVNNPTYRTNFVNAISSFLNKYKLDGIDIDWEYPAQRGGAKADTQNYIVFLKELRTVLGPSKVMSAAVGTGDGYIGTSYDVKGMDASLDFINLMTYDFHDGSDPQTGQNAPLYASSVKGEDKSLNSAATVSDWIAHGATPSKLLLGLAFYGRTFKLTNSADHGIGAPASGPGDAPSDDDESGLLSYLEICKNLKAGGWTTVYDTQQQSPYSYKGNDWVGYDNVQSIKVKAQYALDHNLGGVMMWALDNDDLYNVCGGGATPLLNAITSVIAV